MLLLLEPGCVLRRRTVVVRATVEYVVQVPEDWGAQEIEFQRNESSWCASNLLEELNEIDTAGQCLCALVAFEFLREASEDDEIESFGQPGLSPEKGDD